MRPLSQHDKDWIVDRFLAGWSLKKIYDSSTLLVRRYDEIQGAIREALDPL